MVRARWSRFGLAGLVLATGAPTGLFAWRVLLGDATLGGLAAEWQRDAATYVYVATSTAVVFFAYGAALGRAADRLATLATTDGLTGLMNRAGMAARLAAEVARRRRHPAPLAVLLVDVDRMKEINDRHGHGAGDEALAAVARAIAAACRSTDAAGRWGGDEFLVVAPAATVADAVRMAERVESLLAGATGRPVSVSIGAADAVDGVTDTVETLLAAADAALYRAKDEGRGRVAAAAGGSGRR